MSTIEQERRRIAIDTPLGKDVLLLQSFSGHEEMSRLFSYELELRSTKDSITAKDIVGKRVTFRVEMPDGASRYFNGFVRRFAYCGRGDRMSIYRAEVVPWLWFLTKTSDCRIFQDKKIPEIIEQVFKDLGLTDFDLSGIKGKHEKWDYCVQYRETDFNFVSRLMEIEGIFYFFKHEQGKHTLMLADDKSAYLTCKESSVNFEYNLGDMHNYDEINSWVHQWEFRTGKCAHTDYNFETPSNSLMAKDNSKVQIDGMSKFEHYDYPGEYEQKGDGDNDVNLRMQEEEANHDVVHAASACRSFSPGYKFQVKHHTSSEGGKYVITSIRHSASVGSSYVTGSSDASYYENSFTCIPDSVTFRPARTTPKPHIHGVQTAVVVGPAGEEIYTDKYGRIKVQFHWDREGKKDEKSSCWMRCSQSIAGKQWGSMFIPRIGQEVVVTHLEGDVDRPLVTGVLYNAEQMPPYALPDEKTKSYIKTNSSKGGDGFNEIRFEDKADKEQIFVHAERNYDLRVKHDYMETILGDQHITIGNEKDKEEAGDQKTLIWRDKHEHIKRDYYGSIDGNVSLGVGYGDAENGGRVDIIIAKDKIEMNEKDSHLLIHGNHNVKVDGTQSLQAGMDLQEKVGMNWAIESGMNIHIKAGMCLVLEAGVQLTLKVGGNFVDINPAGVAINGMPAVLVNSGGAPGVGAGAKPTDPRGFVVGNPSDPTLADDSKTGQKSCP